jgi:phosphoribosylformimino-5-aminoimidazole carboxamide ribotide isomerase
MVFSADPVAMAHRWQAEGASRLHLVDLDGARAGCLANLEVIYTIARAVSIPVEVGGGIRTLTVISDLLAGGVSRVVLGTVAVEDPALVQEACARYGEAIVVGIDARAGRVATRGWRAGTDIEAVAFAREMVKLGVPRIIFTDIARDGTLTEPNFSSVYDMVSHVAVPLIAAGGVTSIRHIELLHQLGVEGAIVGRAIYTGDLNLGAAVNLARALVQATPSNELIEEGDIGG